MLLPALLAGCILLVDPTTGSTRCEFSGESTECGACVQQNCQTAVNACCADAMCGAFADLESCATAHGATCTNLQDGNETGTAGAGLASCVAANCRGACQPYSAPGTTSCSDGYNGEGQGTVCTCQLPDANDTVNDFVCSAAAYPGTIRRAPDGWPAPGIQCLCQVLGCDPSQDGCECELVSYTPTEQFCQATQCCAWQDGCTCRASGCYTYETKVETCSVAAVACPTGQVQVASCSIAGGG